MSYLRGVPSFCVWAVIWSRKLVRACFLPLWDDYSLGHFRIFVWSISNIRLGAFEWRLWRLAIVWAAWLSEVLRVKNPWAKSFLKWKIHLLSYDLIKKQADYSNSSLSKTSLSTFWFHLLEIYCKDTKNYGNNKIVKRKKVHHSIFRMNL